MSVRSQNWYDQNQSRSWPFDDSAGLLDAFGKRLPDNLIADLYLKFPRAYGDRAFVSSLTVGTRIVTATFLGTGAGFFPLASISLAKPVEVGVHYSLESLVPGVGGWIVFGNGIDNEEIQTFRFVDALQSVLLAQTARKYDRLPVQSLGKVFTDPVLTGLVRLQGGNDIETRKEEREIDGVTRDVAVIRLKDKLTGGDGARNLLELYAGDCGKRPESRNCGDPEPIEFINTVAPDCCGNIFIEFRGCAEIESIEGECGVVIDCGFGLGAACVTQDRLPDEHGRLPNEYDDRCPNHDEVEGEGEPPATTDEYVFKQNPENTSGLPYTENFNDFVADDFTIISGDFILADNDRGNSTVIWESQEDRDNIALLNLGIFAASGWECIWKKATTVVEIKYGSTGTRDNGGVLFNYRPSVTTPGEVDFWLAEIDWNDFKTFSILHHRGGVWQIRATELVPALDQNKRYKIEVEILPLDADDPSETSAYVVARLTGIDDGLSATAGPVVLPNYYPTTGHFGLYSKQSLTWFEYLTVEDHSP